MYICRNHRAYRPTDLPASMSAEAQRAYVSDEDGSWLAARVLRRGDDGTVTLESLDSKSTFVVSGDELMLANELPEEGVENMTQLNYLHEAALLDNLRYRFGRDHVYTYTGRICIAVNPFNWQVRSIAIRPCPLFWRAPFWRAAFFGELLFGELLFLESSFFESSREISLMKRSL